ncbi:MAG: hypothetical protein WAX15_08555, partial [Blautia wexlerae]
PYDLLPPVNELSENFPVFQICCPSYPSSLSARQISATSAEDLPESLKKETHDSHASLLYLYIFL